MRLRGGRLFLVAAASLLGAALGCQTVDLGAPPADVNLCEPSLKFFVESIWPMFLGNDYSGKHCYDGGCHGSGSTTAMTLTKPNQAMPDLNMPLPADWEANYTQATHRMNCSDPTDSDLLIYPENRVPHGGGMLIMPAGPEETLVSTWVTAP